MSSADGFVDRLNKAIADGVVSLPSGGMQGTEAALAAVLLGRTDLLPFFHPTGAIGANGITSQKSASATALVGTNGLLLATTGVASQFSRLIGYSDGSNFPRYARAGQPWYTSARAKVNTAITAQTKAYVGFGDAGIGGSLRLGVDGAVSTAFFVVAGSAGASIVTTVPIDTAFHVFRAWRVGTVTSVQIDGGTIFTGTTDIAADGAPFAQVENGTDAVNRSLEILWLAAAAPTV